MELSRCLVLTILVLLVLSANSWARPPKSQTHDKHHTHGHSKCQYVVMENDDDDSSDSDDDDFPDNEIPIVITAIPPNRIYDPFLDTEVADSPYVNPNKIVDFIGIKHRFSNDTNLSFPPYVHRSKENKGKHNSGKKHIKNSKTHIKNGKNKKAKGK